MGTRAYKLEFHFRSETITQCNNIYSLLFSSDILSSCALVYLYLNHFPLLLKVKNRVLDYLLVIAQ